MELSSIDGFEWDDGNSQKNFLLHGVSNQEAEEVFFNSPNFVSEDSRHSISERRHRLLGETRTERKLTLIFTLRRNKARVISARDMNRKERALYEKIKKNPAI